MMGSFWMASLKVMTAWDTIFSQVFIAKLEQRLNANDRLFKILNSHTHIDDGLGYYIGDGRTANVLDIQNIVANGHLKASFLWDKLLFPFWIVGDELDNIFL